MQKSLFLTALLIVGLGCSSPNVLVSVSKAPETTSPFLGKAYSLGSLPNPEGSHSILRGWNSFKSKESQERLAALAQKTMNQASQVGSPERYIVNIVELRQVAESAYVDFEVLNSSRQSIFKGRTSGWFPKNHSVKDVDNAWTVAFSQLESFLAGKMQPNLVGKM